jgi:hypothetical protein
MNDHPHDRFDELMRQALGSEAEKVEPDDALHEIRARVRNQRKVVARRPWMLTVGAAAVGTAAAIGAFTMLHNHTTHPGEPEVAGAAGTATSPAVAPSTKPPPTLPPSALPSSTSQPSAAASTDATLALPTERSSPEVAVKGKAVSVYWLGKSIGNTTGAGLRLYRTWTTVNGRPALQAVRLMTADKSGDPDYYSLWTGAVVSSVTQSAGVVTVDFKALPQKQLEPGVADVAVQQLVYTVQGALSDQTEKIRVTEQGRSVQGLFGQFDTSQPFSRALASDVQALVWILTPEQGAGLRSPVTVTGLAAAYEAQVNWRATNTRTKTVVSDYTVTKQGTKQGQGFAPFSFTTRLGPGEWQIEAYVVSPKDGSPTDVDSKTVVVK